jgi:hypothetical protein
MFCCPHVPQQSVIQNINLFSLNTDVSVVEVYFNVYTGFVFLLICLSIQVSSFFSLYCAYETWGSDGGVAESSNFLGCDDVLLGEQS